MRAFISSIEKITGLSRRLFSISLIIFLFAGILFYFGQKNNSYYLMEFELLFDGLADGEYPNGITFSINDILSDDSLERVYSDNSLEGYIEYPDFTDSITITQSGGTFLRLQSEYFSRLKNSGLDPMERSRLEEEYLFLVQSAHDSRYRMVFLNDKSKKIPMKVVSRVFNRLLEDWSRTSIIERGVYLYQIPQVTENILRYNDYLDTNDNWFLFLDKARRIVNSIQENIRSLDKFPSSKSVVTDDGRSISDINFSLNSLERHRIIPLMFLLYMEDEKDSYYMDVYLKSVISLLESNITLLNNLRQVWDSSLRLYLNIYTEDDSGEELRVSARYRTGIYFLDNLINIARMNMDYEFRQNIVSRSLNLSVSISEQEKNLLNYRDLQKNIWDSPQTDPDKRRRMLSGELIEKSINDTANELSKIIVSLNSLYRKISYTDLVNFTEDLYSTAGIPVLIRERPMRITSVISVTFVLWVFFLSFWSIIAGCYKKPRIE